LIAQEHFSEEHFWINSYFRFHIRAVTFRFIKDSFALSILVNTGNFTLNRIPFNSGFTVACCRPILPQRTPYLWLVPT
jgi:hypothetical protein